jgi:uncharacterized membrane protein YbhN (UPF0104 family)
MTQNEDQPDRPPRGDGGGKSDRRGPGLGTLIRVGFVVVTVAFAAWAIARSWDELTEAWRRVEYGPILVAFALVAVGTLAAYPAWREILAGLGSRLPTVMGARVFLVGQLGKYVPGGVWSIIAQVSLARELHVPRSRSATAGVLSILIGLITSGFIGAASLAISGRQVLGKYAWVLVLATPILALLHPAVLGWCARLASKLTKRTIAIERMPSRQLLVAAGIQFLGNLVLGVQFYFVVGTVSGTWLPMLLAIGLFNLASAVGVLVPIAPAGVGVREVILIAGLAPFDGPSMDSGAALLIVLVSRVLSILVDFGWAAAAGIGLALGSRSGQRRTKA